MSDWLNQESDSKKIYKSIFDDLPLVEVQNEENLGSENPEDDSYCGSRFCNFCHLRADPRDESTYHEVATWVRGPKKDSALLREYSGRIAHADCVKKVQSGIQPDQPELFETTPMPVDYQTPAYRQGYNDRRRANTNISPFLGLEYLLGWAEASREMALEANSKKKPETGNDAGGPEVTGTVAT